MGCCHSRDDMHDAMCGCCGGRPEDEQYMDMEDAPVAVVAAAPTKKSVEKQALTAEQKITARKWPNLSEEEVLFLVDLFNKYDKSRTKTIEPQELRPLMKDFANVDLSTKNAAALILKTAPTANRKKPSIGLEDFIVMMTPIVRKKMGPHLETDVAMDIFELVVWKREFAQADKDRSGFIDAGELAIILKVSQDEAKRLMAEHHDGKGGELNFNDFVHFIVKYRKSLVPKEVEPEAAWKKYMPSFLLPKKEDEEDENAPPANETEEEAKARRKREKKEAKKAAAAAAAAQEEAEAAAAAAAEPPPADEPAAAEPEAEYYEEYEGGGEEGYYDENGEWIAAE